MGVGSRHAIPSRAADTHCARGPGGRAGRRPLRQSRPAGVLRRRLHRSRLLCLEPLVLGRAGHAPGAPGRRGAPRRRDLRRAAATRHLGHGGGAHRLPGRRRRHDLSACGDRQRDAGRRPRRGAPRAHGARCRAAGRLGRQRLAHHARRRHGDQQRRLGRADQGRYLGDGHALAPGRQCARRIHGDEPGRGHDTELVDDQRQRQGRSAVQRRRCRPQRLEQRCRRQHDQRQRRRSRFRARHLRRRDGRRLHHRPECRSATTQVPTSRPRADPVSWRTTVSRRRCSGSSCRTTRPS